MLYKYKSMVHLQPGKYAKQAGLLLDSYIFDFENGSNTFLQKTNKLLPDYITSRTRKTHSPTQPLTAYP
jgi:hypothetical protein